MPRKHKSIIQVEIEMAERRGAEILEKMKTETIYSQPPRTWKQKIFKAYLMGQEDQFKMDLLAHDQAMHGGRYAKR